MTNDPIVKKTDQNNIWEWKEEQIIIGKNKQNVYIAGLNRMVYNMVGNFTHGSILTKQKKKNYMSNP